MEKNLGVAGGALMLASSAVGFLGSYLKNKFVFYFFLALTLVAGIVAAGTVLWKWITILMEIKNLVGGGLYIPVAAMIGLFFFIYFKKRY